jgi:hypothetical protein
MYSKNIASINSTTMDLIDSKVKGVQWIQEQWFQ